MKEISKKQIAYGVASATVGLMSSGSVFAADGNTWTGFNVYGGIGYTTMTSKEDRTNSYVYNYNYYSHSSGTNSKSKLSAALGVGYDAQVSEKLVLGVFADMNFGKSTAKSSGAWGYNGNYTYDTSASVKDAKSLGLKLGVPLGANDLLYASAGFTRAKISLTNNQQDSNGNSNSAAISKTKTGRFIGLGLEHKISDQLSMVGDYRVTSFGAVNASNMNGNTAFINHSSKVRTQNLSLNLKYKF
jgi:opacity protein-like surface antigen